MCINTSYRDVRRKITQAELGKYERDEIKPSIDTAGRIADALGVTLDYFVKDTHYQNIDNEALNRLKMIEKLPKEERVHLFATTNAFFAKHKPQSLLQCERKQATS